MEAIPKMAMANDEINHVRRNSVKPGLNADIDLVPITKKQKNTDLLKSIKELHKVGKELSDGRQKA